MKVLFLDIDGVINTQRSVSNPRVQPEGFTANLYGVSKLDPICVARLNKLLEITQASVVISSSWRLLFDDVKDLAKYLTSEGVVANIIDKMPRWAKSYIPGQMKYGRGLEIQEWLDEHPEVTKFVILDDDSDMLHLMPYLVKTSWAEGLEDHHIEQVVRMLK